MTTKTPPAANAERHLDDQPRMARAHKRLCETGPQLELERLAAIGMVTAGVMHESRNVLSSVLAFSQIGKRRAGGDVEDRDLFEEIERSAVRSLQSRILAISFCEPRSCAFRLSC